MPLVKGLVGHINGEQPSDELIDLWRLIFATRDRNVGYDEESEAIAYDEPDTMSAE